MKLRFLLLLLLLSFAASQLGTQTTSGAERFSPPSRTFRFTYSFTVKDIPSEAKQVRVWVHVVQTDRHQTAREI
jgi:hypothetical protein